MGWWSRDASRQATSASVLSRNCRAFKMQESEPSRMPGVVQMWTPWISSFIGFGLVHCLKIPQAASFYSKEQHQLGELKSPEPEAVDRPNPNDPSERARRSDVKVLQDFQKLTRSYGHASTQTLKSCSTKTVHFEAYPLKPLNPKTLETLH